MMMQPQPMMMNTVAYIPIPGYPMPQPACIPPPSYKLPDPEEFQSNAVWQGYYEQDSQKHDMTWLYFQARSGEIVRGKGQDDTGKFVLQGWVEASGLAHFEKQYLGKHIVMYDGQLNGKEIRGTWALEELRGSFFMSRANKTWRGKYH